VYKFPNLSREEVQSMPGYNDISLKDTRFYRDVYDEGRQEGHQEGFHEGRQGECIELVQRLLIRRLGNDPEIARLVATMQTMALEQLEELAEALLEFKTAADLDAWLRKRGVR
ncbi:MAG: DUF4351 domain-containing protein, partial [Gammaproteobacteria bacterium]